MSKKEPKRSLRKFLKFFKKGFYDQKYIDWERGYKWDAHLEWKRQLGKKDFSRALRDKKYIEIANTAVRIESRTNLLFSFEKMALRDAVRTEEGAKLFAEGLFDFIYGNGPFHERFENFAGVLNQLPRKQTRVLTWPLQTVFGFIAAPQKHIFLKPLVTKKAAAKYKYHLYYSSRPNWKTYKSLLDFAGQIKKDLPDLKPRDYIDLQSFIWVMGSEEYE